MTLINYSHASKNQSVLPCCQKPINAHASKNQSLLPYCQKPINAHASKNQSLLPHAAHCFFFLLMACLIEIVFQWACLIAYVPVSWNTLGISICRTYSTHSDACIWDTPRSHSSWSSRSLTGTHPPTHPAGWCHPPWGIWLLPSGSHSGSHAFLPSSQPLSMFSAWLLMLSHQCPWSSHSAAWGPCRTSPSHQPMPAWASAIAHAIHGLHVQPIQ